MSRGQESLSSREPGTAMIRQPGRAGGAGGGRGSPVHDGDIRLFIIQQFFPKLLGQQVHTLFLHGPAAEEQERTWVWA